MKNLKKINWKRMLLDNWVLKLASLILAFILWFVVVVEDNPVEDKTFYGIKVNLVNTKLLEDKGKVYEVLEGTDTLRSVTVEAPRSVLQDLEASDIVAEADLGNLTGIDTVEIEFSCPKYSKDITGIEGNISNVKFSIEDKVSKSINIKYNLIGEVAEGHMINSDGVKLEATRLQLEGPKSKVEQVVKAVVDIDVSGVNAGFATPLDVKLLDKEEKQISSDLLEQSVKSVNVVVTVLTIKEIPIEYTPIGKVAEGYLMTGVVEGTPGSVKIAGSEEAVSRIDKIFISEELDMTNLSESLEKTIDLQEKIEKFGSGIVFADEATNAEAKVTVYVEEEKEKNLKLRRENLQVLNTPDGILAEVLVEQEMPVLQVKGLAADLSTLRESTLGGTIDVAAWMEQNQMQGEALSAGIYSLPVEFSLNEGQNQVNEVYVQVQFSMLEQE